MMYSFYSLQNPYNPYSNLQFGNISIIGGYFLFSTKLTLLNTLSKGLLINKKPIQLNL
jgi:hypothetical protein